MGHGHGSSESSVYTINYNIILILSQILGKILRKYIRKIICFLSDQERSELLLCLAEQSEAYRHNVSGKVSVSKIQKVSMPNLKDLANSQAIINKILIFLIIYLLFVNYCINNLNILFIFIKITLILSLY